jgi:predicted GIY-YIG superfamily endonuclease
MSDYNATPSVKSPEFLYRLRAANGDLLYVGITNNWPSRMKQHQADKPWWSEVLNVEMVRIDGTRAQVEAIEKAVIKAESPTYNVAHNVRVAVPLGRVPLGARSKRLPLGRSVIMAIGAQEDQPATWQVNEADGTCVLLARPGFMLHHKDFGWGEIISITEGGQWLADINFGVGEGIHRFSIADPDLREVHFSEWVDVEHLELEDSIGRIIVGSYCNHWHYGHGSVLQREGQMRFLVRFQGDTEEWIDRTDPQVVRWGK